MTAQRLRIDLTDDRSHDPGGLDAATIELRRELIDIPAVHQAEAADGEPVADAKSGYAEVVGSLVVTLSVSAHTLRQLRGFFHEWLRRNDGKHLRLESNGKTIDITGLSASEIEAELSRILDNEDN